MPAVAVVGAVGAIAIAAEVGTTFAIIAAVGATVGAIGAVTGIKELAIAGTVLGAVGGIGGLASSAGLFGSAADLGGIAGAATDAGSWMGTAGAETVAPLAGEITAAAGPAGGYSLQSLADSGLPGALEGFIPPGGVPAGVDIIDLVNGVGAENFNTLPITEGVEVPTSMAPEVAPEVTVAAQDAALPDVAQTYTPETPPGLIESAAPTDQFGNAIAQGDGDPGAGVLGAGVGNPAAPQPVGNYPADPGTTVAAPNPQTVPGATAGQAPQPTAPAPGTTGAEANVSGFNPGQGPQGPAALAARDAAGIPTGGIGSPSAWSKIFDFVEKRPTLLMGGVMAASSFLSGAMSPLTPAQVTALDAQARNNLAAANLARSQDELLQRRLRNMNEPLPVARFNSPPGLINSPAAAVTGRPA